MARIEYGLDENIPDDVRAALDGKDLLNVFRMMLHSPKMMGSAAVLGVVGLLESTLTPVDRELLILATGLRFQASYEWDQHVPISELAGVTDEQRAALLRGDLDADCFSPAQQELLRFTVVVAASPIISDYQFDAVRAYFTERQVVEAVMLTGFYFLLGRVATVFEVDSDPRPGDEVLRAGARATA
ncbi:carboxymuconolactone decarboxylase family protein [Nocardia sp. NPDC005825]|uniref:carboxymuconolactone decarboxylase family protein n=1 Tax=unclassified Nocardia TaxID=2637762 RepID=UPI0033C875F7